MRWIIEENLFPENVDRLVESLKKHGIKYKLQDFVLYNDVNLNNEESFFYGSLQSAKFLLNNKKKFGNVKVMCNLDKFKCSYYYPIFKDFLFQEDWFFINFGQLKNLFKHTGNFFCRPNSGDKIFTGKLVKSIEDIDYLNFYDEVTPDTLCLIAKPKKIAEEARFVINAKTKNIVTGSLYSHDGLMLENPENMTRIDDIVRPVEIHDYVNKVIQSVDYFPDDFYTLDIAMDENDNFSVLEVNSMSCSGLYNCDFDKIVKEINNV